MRMIPDTPLETGSRAELLVFDQLRSAFGSATDGEWFALHSLNLPRHEYKRFGEIDFIVCGPGGLFVLEVKGGGVSCQAGSWTTTNRYGQVDILRESPFRQAASALHALARLVPGGIIDSFVTGYGVIMPDVMGLPDSAEWEKPVLADARDFRQFEAWLEALIKHWQQKGTRSTGPTVGELQSLLQFLRPDFEAVRSTYVSNHEVEQRIVRLTEDQLSLVDIVEANDRVICTGGAGTGKTIMALEIARRWSTDGSRVALACHSPWLKSCLSKLAGSGTVVTLANSIEVAARRSGIELFDALIVDESQDIFNLAAMSHLDRSLSGGLEHGRWVFFHDINNQSGLCGEYEPEAYELLERCHPARIPLRTNCRNTLPIVKYVQENLAADLGVSAVGHGPAVRVVEARNPIDALARLQEELIQLVEREQFAPSDIVILSQYPYLNSVCSQLPDSFEYSIRQLDEYSPRGSTAGKIGFAEIENYKGLESPCIVLIDLPPLDSSSKCRALYYVGLSRARVQLTVIHF